MTARRKLIVVSNRGPVSTARRRRATRVARRGGGGLVTALRSLVSHHDVTWIASAMSDEDRAVAAERGGERVRRDRTRRLAVPAAPRRARPARRTTGTTTSSRTRRSGSSSTTCGASPYAPDLDLGLHHAWFNGYVPVNQRFADATVAELEREPGAAVFFHDYHLYLAPRLVREQRPDALLAHFVHIPWPETDYWHVLPEHLRRAIHEGLLANDVLGFHTARWRRNFLRTCEDILGAEVDYERRRSRTAGGARSSTSHPIGVDPAEFEELKDDPTRARGGAADRRARGRSC